MYIHPVSTDSGRANIVQTLNMISEFSEVFATRAFYSGGDVESLQDYNIPLESIKFHFGKLDRVIQSKHSIVRAIGLILFALNSLALSERHSIVFTRDPLIAIIALLWGRKVVFEEHAYVKSLFFNKIRVLLYSSNNVAVIFISKALSELYASDDLIPRHKTIYHDCARVFSTAKTDYNKNISKIGLFGTLGKGRGYDLVSALAMSYCDVDFHVFGRRTECHEFEGTPNNLYFYNPIPHRMVRNRMLEYDLLLVPYEETALDGGLSSYLWMSPIKLFESMESGIPFICSDLPVLREVVDESHCFLANAGNLDSWVAAIERAKSPEARKKKALNARNEIILNYNWQERVKFIYNDLCRCGFL